MANDCVVVLGTAEAAVAVTAGGVRSVFTLKHLVYVQTRFAPLEGGLAFGWYPEHQLRWEGNSAHY
jgi:hypothetical protein